MRRKILMLLVITLFANIFMLSGCEQNHKQEGIISNLEFSRDAICTYEGVEKVYINVAVTITIDDSSYIGKELEFVATSNDKSELHRQNIVFDDSKVLTVSYKEYTPAEVAIAISLGVASQYVNTQTHEVFIYDGDTIVGSGKISLLS